MADDRVANGHVFDGGADCVHPAGVLVPEDHRQWGRDGVFEPAIGDVQVGAAQPGAANPDDHVARPGDPGLCHVVQLSWLSV